MLFDRPYNSDIDNVLFNIPYNYGGNVYNVAEFAVSEPVPGFNDGTLQMAFVDLRQIAHW